MTYSQTSGGVIIYRNTSDGKSYLLLQYIQGHWNFVKGKVEDGETAHEAAIRETKEETGITDLHFIDGFSRHVEYDFTYNGQLIHKTVIYYLAESKTVDIILSDEHQSSAWLSIDDAIKRTTHKNSKNILILASEYLSSLDK
ncbi:MAG: bis(5'-nucleosyl)-tetraphosphatase [Candidatus Nitrosoabyssus spongiisocia]|nr:MAG: bis(5'-nucleosyl)-tetraphosphatase [Nitrosopumilaceae archaeon AB1(1)]